MPDGAECESPVLEFSDEAESFQVVLAIDG
jgi:hypothetical protein